MKFAWIAVAAATAIRLFSGPQLWSAAVVAALALAAFLLRRKRSVRLAALCLFLVAVVDAVSIWRTTDLARSFAKRSADHVAHDVAHVREQVTVLEAQLDGTAARITRRIAGKENDRAALFLILKEEIGDANGRGARILDADGEPVAWWGEDYRAPGNRTYQFDVTNLYVTRSRTAKGFSIQAFARIENIAGRMPVFHEDDAWVVSMNLHGGFPRQEKGTHRALVSKRDDSSLFIDVVPRGATEVVEAVRAEGTSVAAVLLAIGALVVFVNRLRTPVAIVPLLVARVALLPVNVPNDPLGIFDFQLYGSRILRAFSRSPFDLLLTAATILAVVILLAPYLRRLPLLVRALLAGAAAWGYIRLVDNFVANSRVSALPDHVVPATLVQGVLFAALLLLAFAVVRLAALLFANIRLERDDRYAALRVAAKAIVVAAVVYVPLHVFGNASARQFISDT